MTGRPRPDESRPDESRPGESRPDDPASGLPTPDPELRAVGEEGHTRKRIVTHGVPAEEADAAAILIHGRGGSPEGMLTLAGEEPIEGLAWIAPYADGNTWYPQSFMSPLEQNEPWLSSALQWLDEIVADLDEQGIPPTRIGFVGFSQGACLASEFVARHPRRYGGVAALSGGLVGPPESDFERRFGLTGDAGSLAGTPVFLGCSDVDPHIPEERVRESARILETLGASVNLRIYSGMGHTVNDEEMAEVRSLLKGLMKGPGD